MAPTLQRRGAGPASVETTDLSVAVLAVSWTETAFGLLFFSLRFITNWRLLHRFRLDFALAAFTVVCVQSHKPNTTLTNCGGQAIETTAQIFLQLAVDSGMGHHTRELSPSQIVSALKWGWVFQLLAIMASLFGKLAIIAFLLEIRGKHDKKPWFLWIIGILLIIINLTVMGTILAQCRPVQKLWDDALPGTCNPGRLVNQNYSFFQASTLHGITPFRLVLTFLQASIPLPMLLLRSTHPS